jgi:hypothetical protein
MKKLLLGVTIAVLVLAGCAGGPGSSASAANDPGAVPSRSGVDFYGTLDAGVGSQKISR